INRSIHTRGVRGRPLSKRQQDANRKKNKVRARIEHIFGTQENAPGERIVRSIGFERAAAKIGLQNLVYNMRRMVSLERMAAT
ncbi:MAG: transposase, partial [Chloroflexi bacterium]|nr:transposase [Chloroflexota bacterium]